MPRRFPAKAAALLLAAICCLGSPASADPVSLGARIVLASNTNWFNGFKAVVARVPLGQGIVIWGTAPLPPSAQGARLSFVIVDANGNPTTSAALLPLPASLSIVRPEVSAWSGGFVLVFEGYGGSDPSGSGIYAQRLDLVGNLVGSLIQVNVVTAQNQADPSVMQRADGAFAVAWRTLDAAALTQGIWLRRFDAFAAPLDTVESRADDPVMNLNNQSAPDVAFWPTGECLAVWSDGTPTGLPSRDGDGMAVIARAFAPNLLPVASSDFVVNPSGLGHQFWPRVGLGHAGDCTIAWSSQNEWGSQIQRRRFGSNGAPALGGSLQILAPYPAGFGHASDVVVAADGDEVVAFARGGLFYSGPVSFAQPAGIARFSACNVWQEDVPLAASSFSESHLSAAAAVDQFGNILTVAVDSAIAIQHARRTQIVFTPAVPSPGTTVNVDVSAGCSTGSLVFAASFGLGPIAIDHRVVRLSPDALFFASLASPLLTVLPFGATMSLPVPALPALSGVTVYFAAASPGSGGIGYITDTYALSIL